MVLASVHISEHETWKKTLLSAEMDLQVRAFSLFYKHHIVFKNFRNVAQWWTLCFFIVGPIGYRPIPGIFFFFFFSSFFFFFLASKGTCQKRFSGIRPLRGYPPTMGEQWLLKQFCLNHPVEHIQKPKLPKLYVRVETSTSYFIIHNQFVK